MSIRSNFPLAYCFGEVQPQKTQEELQNASPGERLKSAWGCLAARVAEFQKTLKPHEQATFDFEDSLSEVAASLLEMDHEWNPSRGKYITYAMTIANHTLYAIRARSTVVHAPPNSSARMKKYTSEETSGCNTPKKRKTANDIRRASRGATTLATQEDIEGFHEESGNLVVSADQDVLEALEISAERIEIIKRAIKQLLPQEAAVIGKLFGIWGQHPKNTHWIGVELGLTESEVRNIKSRGMAKMRKFLIGGQS